MYAIQSRTPDRIAPPAMHARGTAPAAALGDGTAAFVIDRGLKVLVANQAGYALAADGKSLSIALGRLRTRSAVLNARLERSIRELGPTNGEARLAVTVNGRPRTMVVIALGAPADAANDAATPHAVVLVKEPKADVQHNVETVGRAVGLTAAETRLLKLICEGHGTVAAARRLGVATTTARTHLARIFSKTATGRQSELVQFVVTFIPEAC
jgi:DNA-binding CsgD family transcriptional regulator